MVQLGLPDGTDYKNPQWSLFGAATAHQCIDEGTAGHDGNTTRMECSVTPKSFRVTLSTLIDPHIHTGHIMRMTVRGAGDVPAGPPTATTDIVRYYLKQGPGAPPGGVTFFDGGLYRGWNTWSHTLTAGEAALITDYDGLEIQIHAQALTGITVAGITAAEFECPDPGHVFGNADIEVGADGDLQGKNKIDGDAELQVDADGTLTGKGKMIGDIELHIESSPLLGAVGVMIGDTAIVIDVTGTITGVSKLMADTEIALDLVGLLLGKAAMVGDTEIDIDADGDLTGKAGMTGDTEIDIDADGDLTGKAAMVGDTEIDIDADGDLTGKAAMVGDTEIDIDADGDLTGKAGMTGDTELQIDAAATLTGKGVMVGDTELQIDLDGTLTAGGGTLSGDAGIQIDLDGIATGVGAMQGDTEIEITLDGVLTGVVPEEPGGSFLFINGAAVMLEMVSEASAVQVLRKSGNIGGAHKASPISLVMTLPASIVHAYLRRALARDNS